MSIEVHNPHVINNLVADAHRQRTFPKSLTHTPAVRDQPPRRRKTAPIPAHFKTTAAAKLTTEDIEEECYAQLMCNERVYRQLTCTENTFVKSLDELLDRAKQKHRCKYNVLFSKWEEGVYNKVHGDIKTKLDSNQYSRLDRQKRQLFSRYLKTCNAKGTVFLDVISKKEYDPLGLANRGLKTTVPTRSDPTKLLQNEDKESSCIEQQCGLKSSDNVSVGFRDARGTCNEWIRLPTKDVDSHIRQRSRQRMVDKTACSVPALNTDELKLQKKQVAFPSYSLHRPLSQMFY